MKELGPWRSAFREFWLRVLSPQTARFVLAGASLLAADAAFYMVLQQDLPQGKIQLVTFALGQLFALPFMAFGYYFGSTARGDERPLETKVINDRADPVPVEGEQ